MRQFKFRAWHKESQIMTDFSFSSLMGDSSNGEVYIYFRNEKKQYSTKICSEELIIMQYLGEDCKDCEEIEICEGDIIEDEDVEKYLIKYNIEFGCFWPEEYDYEAPFDYSECRIIGNIHQNPELLND